MVKICGKCKETKDMDAFAWKSKSKGTKQYQCRSCQNKYRTEHYQRNKDKIYIQIKSRQIDLINKVWNYKENNPCVDCGESDPIVLEFDHLRDKEFNIGDSGRHGYSWERILEEIDKCEVVCRNCHIRRTWKRAGWTRNNAPLV